MHKQKSIIDKKGGIIFKVEKGMRYIVYLFCNRRTEEYIIKEEIIKYGV